MKKYFISHTNKDEKEKNIMLWNDIRDNGKYVKNEWNGDYLVTTYKYNNKIYELWENMEYGIMSEIVEISNFDY